MWYLIYGIFIILFLIFIFISLYFLKKNITYILYLSFFFIFIFILILNYIEDFLFYCIFLLEENLILKNPNDWVWAIYLSTFYITFIIFIPYLFLYLYINNCNLFFKVEQKKLQISFLSIYYYYFLSIIFLFDFIQSSIIVLNVNKDIFFEFQPEMENFIFFIFGTFFDFFITLNFILILIYIIVKIKRIKFNFIILIFISFWIFYWFSGSDIINDSFLILVSFIFIEIIRWGFFFLFHLSKIKNFY